MLTSSAAAGRSKAFGAVEVDLKGALVLLPVRHHSPACAGYIADWIRAHRPAAVLVEGPADANPLIPELLDPDTVPPVALYSFLRQSEGASHACWYPFCAHSPEYVALREGGLANAKLGFIDLPTWWHAQLLMERTGEQERTNVYGDHRLSHHAFIQELCQQSNCRDFDDLWDHLFETSARDRSSDQFWREIATYCQIARLQSPSQEFASDGTNIRESYMAARIVEARREFPDGKILVVTGGFHRGGILELLDGEFDEPAPPALPRSSEHGCYLTAYGDKELDRWSGYQSGMPAPAYYRFLWGLSSEPVTPALAAAQLLGELRRHLSQQGLEVSVAEVIAAEGMLLALAQFRGHEIPSREDLRDAVRSTWIKGAMDEAHGHLLTAVDQFLVGSAVGVVSAKAGAPPIVRDFDLQLKELRLPKRQDRAMARQVNLDIHGRKPHRKKSAFLHRLTELGVPYARLEMGPDFVGRKDLDRVREIWQVRWLPAVDGALVERSIYGVTIAEAAERHLLLRFRKLEAAGADSAVEILTRALVMSFPQLAQELTDAVESRLESEGEFAAAADALSGLVQLLSYQALLEAERFPKIEELAGKAYRRSVWLLDSLPGLSHQDSGAQTRVLRSLSRLRHVVLAGTLAGIDAELLFEALAAAADRLGRIPVLEGAVLGVLRQAGKIDDERVRAAVRASVDNTAAGPEMPLGDFLRGLFVMIRHAVVEQTGLLEIVHRCITELGEERFREVLPALRLAFTHFSPRETRRLAQTVESWCIGGAQTVGADSTDAGHRIGRDESDAVEIGRPIDGRAAEAWKKFQLDGPEL